MVYLAHLRGLKPIQNIVREFVKLKVAPGLSGSGSICSGSLFFILKKWTTKPADWYQMQNTFPSFSSYYFPFGPIGNTKRWLKIQ